MGQAQILLVEDTDSVREVLTRQLQALGASVTALPDGDRVKSTLNQRQFDLVIADLQLPDCSGIDIARFARAKNCKVILLSGEGGLGSRLDIKSAGFDEILSKPVALEQLQEILVRFSLAEEQLNMTQSTGPEMDETGVIDLHSLREQMGELDRTALSMLIRFPDMMRPLVKRIAESVEQKDYKNLADIAHSLKGAARSAGATHLGELSDKAQIAAQESKIDIEACSELQTEFIRVENAINRLCQ